MTRRTAPAPARTRVSAMDHGRLIERTIAEVITLGLVPTAAQVLAVAHQVAADLPNSVARTAAVSACTTGARFYFRYFALPAPWRLEAYQLRLDGSRPDLCWRSTASGAVVLDEVKAGYFTRSGPSARWLEQSRNHLRAGLTRFGDDLLAVRLLPVQGAATAQALLPDGRLISLAEARLEGV